MPKRVMSLLDPVSRRQGNELLNKLEEAGLDPVLAQAVIVSKDNWLATRIVRFIANRGYEPKVSHDRAREIMGKSFFGIEEAIKCFGIVPSKAQIAELSEVPFSEQELVACKETHILIAVFPMSILEIRSKAVKNFVIREYNEQSSLASYRGNFGWRLVRKSLVRNSIRKDLSEQRVLLNRNEEVPSAQVMVYTIIGYYLATGNRLFQNYYVRTSTSCGGIGCHRVVVGDFKDAQLDLACLSTDCRYSDVGLAGAYKLF